MSRPFCLAVLALTTAIALVSRPAVGEPRVFDLMIRDGALSIDQRVIRVQQGDAVSLRWTSDRTLTLHLHGYDIEQRVTAGTPMTMNFTARATGRFPIEIHGAHAGSGATLAYLEVHPR